MREKDEHKKDDEYVPEGNEYTEILERQKKFSNLIADRLHFAFDNKVVEILTLTAQSKVQNGASVNEQRRCDDQLREHSSNPPQRRINWRPSPSVSAQRYNQIRRRNT